MLIHPARSSRHMAALPDHPVFVRRARVRVIACLVWPWRSWGSAEKRGGAVSRLAACACDAVHVLCSVRLPLVLACDEDWYRPDRAGGRAAGRDAEVQVGAPPGRARGDPNRQQPRLDAEPDRLLALVVGVGDARLPP